MRGLRWVVGSSNHGCWLGSFELEVQRYVVQKLRSGDVFYDVGANVGCFTLLASRSIGPSGRVVAFEPFSQNVAALERHLALNDIENVTVVPAAVSSAQGEARFAAGVSNSTGRLSSTGEIVVKTVVIDPLVADGTLPAPNMVKIDVEGAAGEVIAGAVKTFASARPLTVLAIHGPEEHRVCADMLTHIGYRMFPLATSGGNWVCEPE